VCQECAWGACAACLGKAPREGAEQAAAQDSVADRLYKSAQPRDDDGEGGDDDDDDTGGAGGDDEDDDDGARMQQMWQMAQQHKQREGQE